MQELKMHELEQVSGGAGVAIGLAGLIFAVAAVGYNDGRQDKLR